MRCRARYFGVLSSGHMNHPSFIRPLASFAKLIFHIWNDRIPCPLWPTSYPCPEHNSEFTVSHKTVQASAARRNVPNAFKSYRDQCYFTQNTQSFLLIFEWFQYDSLFLSSTSNPMMRRHCLNAWLNKSILSVQHFVLSSIYYMEDQPSCFLFVLKNTSARFLSVGGKWQKYSW